MKYALNLAVIQIYVPTIDSSEDKIGEFCNTLESTLSYIPKKDVKIIMGGWNAKERTENEGQQSVMDRYGYGTINERGEKLTDVAGKHNFFIVHNK